MGRPTTKMSVMMTILLIALLANQPLPICGMVADRSRVVRHRQTSGTSKRFRDNGKAIEGQHYRSVRLGRNGMAGEKIMDNYLEQNNKNLKQDSNLRTTSTDELNDTIYSAVSTSGTNTHKQHETSAHDSTSTSRHLSSQLTGCCYTYADYGSADLCGMYNRNCEGGGEGGGSQDNEECSQEGLSFIGISFSVNTANGNPYSYQLCDQFPVENIIDRDYNYVMSMDEDGWLVGGGYKPFDYSGKMPYIDSSHTELLRVGSMDQTKGGTSTSQVYSAMESVTFPPFSLFPEYVKGGGGHHSGDEDDEGTPSGDVTFIVSIVEEYSDDDGDSTYNNFMDDLFDAFDSVGGGDCMDDHDTDPHVSMSRGVKFASSYAMQQYQYSANLEVAVWQAMYPNGVVIGTSGSAAFPPGRGGRRQKVGYGNLYFFFDRANITMAFNPNSYLSDEQKYYATLYASSDTSEFYADTTEIGFDYGGSHDDENGDWEHNPYGWKATNADHDFTDGWDLPPNCQMEGETFFGIPLSRKSDSTLQSSSTFQTQFDFESLIDRNYTYVDSFGTNHGWLIGEAIDNGVGSIVDKDTAHIPIFYAGNTNPAMGGLSLSNLIKIGKQLDFGPLYIKPAFVFIDDFGHLKLQFEADSSSSLGYLYDSLCKQVGIAWNYDSPSNDLGVYSNCAMHSAGDRSQYGCGPDGAGTGGFCPQMTIAYSVQFYSEDHSTAYLESCNNYVDYWRSMYPSGVAVGWKKFCPDGGCLGLFLNRMDLYNVFKPDLGGSWVEYNGASMAPTYSPAPTFKGGCSEPKNFHLDKCFRKHVPRPRASAIAWDSLGVVGQMSVLLVAFMATTLSISIFLARARKRKRSGEGYLAFFFRDLNRKKKRKKKLRRRHRHGNGTDMAEEMLRPRERSEKRSRSRSKRSSSRGRMSRSRGAESRGTPRRSRSRVSGVGGGNEKSPSKRESAQNEGSGRHQLV